MIGFLIYDAKVAVLIVVFYMFYRLLLSKETFHRVNRVVLLSTAVLSFLLPLCVIDCFAIKSNNSVKVSTNSCIGNCIVNIIKN